MEMDDKIESREILRPVYLTAHKDLSSSKVFEIFVISDNINKITGTSKIMMPWLESFEDHKKLFVMNIIIKCGTEECMGMENNGVNFTVG